MALLYKQLSPLHGVWKMEESSDELLGMLEHKADYSSFLERVSAEKRRQERFASRVLLKELLGEEVRVDYHSTGAPFLACVPLYISISHTKDYVAVILDKRPTGIDIEYRSDRILKIRSRFMNPEEEAGEKWSGNASITGFRRLGDLAEIDRTISFQPHDLMKLASLANEVSFVSQ